MQLEGSHSRDPERNAVGHRLAYSFRPDSESVTIAETGVLLRKLDISEEIVLRLR